MMMILRDLSKAWSVLIKARLEEKVARSRKQHSTRQQATDRAARPGRGRAFGRAVASPRSDSFFLQEICGLLGFVLESSNTLGTIYVSLRTSLEILKGLYKRGN